MTYNYAIEHYWTAYRLVVSGDEQTAALFRLCLHHLGEAVDVQALTELLKHGHSFCHDMQTDCSEYKEIKNY